MERALQLAALGRSTTSPNPMVGAVIADAQGKIIGEGWHRKCGEGHAEVNAVASVDDKELLKDSTMYVTLEPCSHYGKTPPCAELIIRMGIPRVVVGCLDPFEKVSGRGIKMLREAGIEVIAPFMEEECRALNRRFMTAHINHRPYVLLKWAQSADGYLDTRLPSPDGDHYEGKPAKWSTPLSSTIMHILRSRYDAVMTGSSTILADNPRLTVRIGESQNCRQPLKVTIDRRGRITKDMNITDGGLIYREGTLEEILNDLYSRGITSLMVEGGATLLNSFICEDLWDEARIEITPYPAQLTTQDTARFTYHSKDPLTDSNPNLLSDSNRTQLTDHSKDMHTDSNKALSKGNIADIVENYPRVSVPQGTLRRITTIDSNKIIEISRFTE